jgi:hypothetical protein
MAHSPNLGATPLKDETADPAIPSRWKKSRKTGSSFEKQEYGPGTNLRRRIAAD